MTRAATGSSPSKAAKPAAARVALRKLLRRHQDLLVIMRQLDRLTPAEPPDWMSAEEWAALHAMRWDAQQLLRLNSPRIAASEQAARRAEGWPPLRQSASVW
jgi:hypothetical protein